MKKYKICVYAICKNEEKHIKRWYESMKEADEIYVLDTGSTDNSVSILKSLGVHVKTKNYKHFKFDQARNDSLKLVPDDTDICVCTDIDEVFSKNWRKELESIWNNNLDKVRYNMNFTFDEEGNPLSTYYIGKIHKKSSYTWTHSIHEVLTYIGSGEEKVLTTNKIEINHYPDRTKDRSNYLKLLIEAVEEYPEDDRNMHYLGREYMYNKMWSEAIKTLKKHLNLKSSTWKEERSASMRYLGRIYMELEDYNESEHWYKLAIKETPYLREPYIELGMLYWKQKEYALSICFLEKGESIKKKSDTYINEEYAWNETIYDLLSICYFGIENKEKAIENILKALKINKNNERIKNNYRIMMGK